MSDHPLMNNVSQYTASNKKGLNEFVNEDVFQLNKFEEPIRKVSVKPKNFLTRMKDILFLFIGIKDFAGQNVEETQADLASWITDEHPILKRGFENLKERAREKVRRYPWVVGISTVLAVSVFMIRLVKPTRKVLKYLK
jgi:hypothetical protein